MTEAVRPDSGAITRGFLFADLRGYTAYVEAHGDDAASELLDVYRRLVRDTVARHQGAEIRTEGDSFYVVFPSASGAVLCGLEIAVAAAAQCLADPQHPTRVGIGVHAGESVAAAEGYVGSAVNIAARVCAIAKPGEVLVTDTVRSLTRTSGRLVFTPIGRRTLKGITEPIALYRAELAGTGAAADASGHGPIWRRPSVVAGAGGLVVLVLAALVVKGGFDPAGASPSASVAPSASEPASSSSPLIGQLPVDRRTIAPGTYAPNRNKDVVSVTVSKELDQSHWWVVADTEDVLWFERPIPPGTAGVALARISVVYKTGCKSDGTQIIGGSPTDLIDWVQSAPQFDASELGSATALGRYGIGIEATVVAPPAGSCQDRTTNVLVWSLGESTYVLRAGSRILFEALNDGSRTLAVVFSADNATELIAARDASENLLNSMVLQK